MKLTKKQLKQMIREQIELESDSDSLFLEDLGFVQNPHSANLYEKIIEPNFRSYLIKTQNFWTASIQDGENEYKTRGKKGEPASEVLKRVANKYSQKANLIGRFIEDVLNTL